MIVLQLAHDATVSITWERLHGFWETSGSINSIRFSNALQNHLPFLPSFYRPALVVWLFYPLAVVAFPFCLRLRPSVSVCRWFHTNIYWGILKQNENVLSAVASRTMGNGSSECPSKAQTTSPDGSPFKSLPSSWVPHGQEISSGKQTKETNQFRGKEKDDKRRLGLSYLFASAIHGAA